MGDFRPSISHLFHTHLEVLPNEHDGQIKTKLKVPRPAAAPAPAAAAAGSAAGPWGQEAAIFQFGFAEQEYTCHPLLGIF